MALAKVCITDAYNSSLSSLVAANNHATVVVEVDVALVTFIDHQW